MPDIYIIQLESYNSTTAVVETERFSTGAGYDPSNDLIKPVRGRVIDAGNYNTALYSEGKTYGSSSVGSGEVRLNNGDGALDYLINRGLDGRKIEILRGDSELSDISEFITLFTGVIEIAEYTRQEIRLRIKNGFGEFYDTPIVSERFSGDTTDTTYGSGGHVNGSEDDWQGKTKPLLIGNGGGENFSPPMVNVSKQTFMISSEPVTSITDVWMSGAAITHTSPPHTSLTSLQAATVSSGRWECFLGDDTKPAGDPERGAYIRIGSALDGQVTCKAYVGATDADRSIAQNADYIFNLVGKTLSSDSITEVDAANNSPCGYWVPPEETKAGRVLDEILGGGGVWWTQNNSGIFIMGQLVSPNTQAATKTLTSLNKDKVVRITPTDDNSGVPVSEIVVNYNRNYTVQDEGNLAGIVGSDDARVLFLKNEWRSVFSQSSSDVTTKHITAIPMEIDSYFTVETDAQDEADRQKNIRSLEQDFIKITEHESKVRDISMGDVIAIEYDRYTDTGLDNYLVLGKRLEYSKGIVTLLLWKTREL